MSADELRQSEEASLRAKRFMESGEPRKSCEAYLEAADHMMRFAKTQYGQRRADTQALAERLLLKAKSARMEADKRDASVASAKPTPSFPSNRNAISRDLESQRRGGAPASDPENRLKFAPVQSPNVHFSDIAGLENVKSIVRLKVIEPILHPELYQRFSKSSNGGILLYGPPGTGKTMIARAIATETQLDFFSVRCSDIVGKGFGDGERNLKELIDAARESGHAMVFFDEFESLACKRGGGSTVMNRIVPELLSQMDGFQQAEGVLVVLASTNRPCIADNGITMLIRSIQITGDTVDRNFSAPHFSFVINQQQITLFR